MPPGMLLAVPPHWNKKGYDDNDNENDRSSTNGRSSPREVGDADVHADCGGGATYGYDRRQKSKPPRVIENQFLRARR